MVETVILYRINEGKVQAISNADDTIATFPDRDAADRYCTKNPLFQSGQAIWQIVELDEL